MKKATIQAGTNIEVYTSNTSLFYKAEAGKLFNLPTGNYAIFGVYKVLPFRLLTKINLPQPEKIIKYKGIKKIALKDNPNKCSIDISSGAIYFDRDFFNTLSLLEFRFVMFHELGHYFYKTEEKADKYACFMMLQIGYNASQIFGATKKTLIDKNRIVDNFLNLKR